MATKKVSSKDPRVQAALDERRARVAAKVKSRESANKPKAKARVETKKPGNIFQKRANMINNTVKKAVRGK